MRIIESALNWDDPRWKCVDCNELLATRVCHFGRKEMILCQEHYEKRLQEWFAKKRERPILTYANC